MRLVLADLADPPRKVASVERIERLQPPRNAQSHRKDSACPAQPYVEYLSRQASRDLRRRSRTVMYFAS
ncbi:MAG: hypothetical protein KIT09_36115, partial [Bryobacteraceae bacterium]|nr:hypothetical protein [Bryobacteraceae bacterium]